MQAEFCCCFTGHRPEKIVGTEDKIRSRLICEILKAVESGFQTFITGVAPGVDIWAAQEVLAIKQKYPNIRLVCAVPYKGVENIRSEEEKSEFNRILSLADEVIFICKRCARWSFIVRDKWMVDHVKRVIAVFNGTHGGTEFTINYAKKKGVPINLIKDE